MCTPRYAGRGSSKLGFSNYRATNLDGKPKLVIICDPSLEVRRWVRSTQHSSDSVKYVSERLSPSSPSPPILYNIPNNVRVFCNSLLAPSNTHGKVSQEREIIQAKKRTTCRKTPKKHTKKYRSWHQIRLPRLSGLQAGPTSSIEA